MITTLTKQSEKIGHCNIEHYTKDFTIETDRVKVDINYDIDFYECYINKELESEYNKRKASGNLININNLLDLSTFREDDYIQLYDSASICYDEYSCNKIVEICNIYKRLMFILTFIRYDNFNSHLLNLICKTIATLMKCDKVTVFRIENYKIKKFGVATLYSSDLARNLFELYLNHFSNFIEKTNNKANSSYHELDVFENDFYTNLFFLDEPFINEIYYIRSHLGSCDQADYNEEERAKKILDTVTSRKKWERSFDLKLIYLRHNSSTCTLDDVVRLISPYTEWQMEPSLVLVPAHYISTHYGYVLFEFFNNNDADSNSDDILPLKDILDLDVLRFLGVISCNLFNQMSQQIDKEIRDMRESLFYNDPLVVRAVKGRTRHRWTKDDFETYRSSVIVPKANKMFATDTLTRLHLFFDFITL